MLDPDAKIFSRATTRIALAILASIVCAAVFVGVTVSQRAADAQKDLQQDIVLRGGDAIGLSFNTALKREWDSLHAVARNVSVASRSQTNDFMDAVAQAGGRVAWAGIADLSGKIISGSNRMREGEDVSESGWYQVGLRGANVGSVYSSRLPNGEDQGESLIDLSTPIYGSETGEVIGVVVYSLRMAWVSSFLTQARERLNIDIVVENREGDILVDTRGVPTALPVAAVMRAALGRNAPGSFHIVDDQDGLYAFTPNFVSDALPDFGWKVYAVLDLNSVKNVLPQLLRDTVIAIAIAAMFVLGVAILALRLILRPFEELTATALQMGNGNDAYPRETRASREAIMLSRALVLIQQRMRNLPNAMGQGASVIQMVRPTAAGGASRDHETAMPPVKRSPEAMGDKG